MRIGIISDSHGNTNAIDQAVKVAGEIDFWLHAGDLINDAEYLRMAYDAEVVNVAGNCDWGYHGAEDEELVTAAGSKIFLTFFMKATWVWPKTPILAPFSRTASKKLAGLLFTP